MMILYFGVSYRVANDSRFDLSLLALDLAVFCLTTCYTVFEADFSGFMEAVVGLKGGPTKA